MYTGDNDFLIQAHRGYSGKYPENTLLSFQKAIETGADIVEFDLHLSKDKELIVIHDLTVNRVTDGTGRISELTKEEIKKLDAGTWFDSKFAGERIPTFSETLDLLKNQAIASIEIKTEFSGYKNWREMIDIIIKIVDNRKMWDQVMFISFDPRALLAVIKRRPQAFTGFIDYQAGEEVLKMKMIKSAGIDGWFAPWNIVTKRLVQKAQNMGLKVLSGGGKDLSSINQEVKILLEVDVDGISTDFPGEVKEILMKNTEE